jgi:hypothetical protein
MTTNETPAAPAPATPARMTAEQAADETLLLLSRKFRRLAPDAFAKAWRQLPAGAQQAITAAENRADILRAQQPSISWPEIDTDDE